MKLISYSKFRTSVALLALPFLLVAGTAAAQTVTGVDSIATGILGLQVGSETYDITFVSGTAEEVYPSDVFDFTTLGDAVAVVAAIAEALNPPDLAESTEWWWLSPDEDQQFLVAYQRAGDNVTIVLGYLAALTTPSRTRWVGDVLGQPVPATQPSTWAIVATPTPVESATWGKIKALYE